MLFPMITIPASISATDRPIKRPETKSFTSEPLIVAAIALQAIPRRIRITPYYDSILSAPNAVSVTTIAKDYGMSAKVLNEFLHQLGIQYKRGGTWMLYQKYADKGYTRTETVYLPQSNRAQINMKWTQKGRMFIYEQMKKVGMLPVCEKEVA